MRELNKVMTAFDIVGGGHRGQVLLCRCGERASYNHMSRCDYIKERLSEELKLSLKNIAEYYYMLRHYGFNP